MFTIFPDEQALAKQLSQELYTSLAQQPKLSLGLATGSTMLPIYQELIQLHRTQPLDLTQLTTFNLDEYLGLSPDHPQSYNYFMHQHLFKYLPLTTEQTHLPQGLCTDVEAQCAAYRAKIAAVGGIDIQLLGIGSNGHIGFNEPLTPFDSITHIAHLTAKTRQDNSRFFTNQAEVPTRAITLGLSEISQAKKVYLVITGQHKATISAKLFASQVTETLPASILKQHSNAHIYLDAAAASQLPEEVQAQLLASKKILC